MEQFGFSLTDTLIQCWTCPIFDKLFAIISNSAGAVYEKLTYICLVIFVILFIFYIFHAVWQNAKSDSPDPLYQKSIKPVIIKSLIVLTLLTLGSIIPQLISKVTFEPIAQLTLGISKSLLPQDYAIQGLTQTSTITSKAFFSSELRDTLLTLIESTVSHFQIYIKMGINIIDKSFASGLLGIGALWKNVIIFFIGLYLTYNFLVLFIKYSFCFLDIVVAMAMFAFLFPLSLILFIFKGAADAPSWLSSLGSSLGGGQIKKVINAIVSVLASVLTYTLITRIINAFFISHNVDPTQIATSSLFNFNLDTEDLATIGFVGCLVLLYVIKFIADQIPKITEKILGIFSIKIEDSISKEVGESVFQLTKNIGNTAKQIATTIITKKAASKPEAEAPKSESPKPTEKKK